jgi:predicted N-acetyltransferase YhbS
MVTIRQEKPPDSRSIEHLLDIAFEPARHGRPSYRLREGVARIESLCFVAESEGQVVGVVRFWPIQVDGRPALLLGPIAVHPDAARRGVGSLLVRTGLDAARVAGWRLVVAIGAQGYLGRFGFAPAAPRGLSFPVPVDEARFLVLELVAGALEGLSGRIERAAAEPARARR